MSASTYIPPVSTSVVTVYSTVTLATVTIFNTALTESITTNDATVTISSTEATVTATATATTTASAVPFSNFALLSTSGNSQGFYALEEVAGGINLDGTSPSQNRFTLSGSGQLIDFTTEIAYYYDATSDQGSNIVATEFPSGFTPFLCSITPQLMLDCSTSNGPFVSLELCSGNLAIIKASSAGECGPPITLQAVAALS